MDSTSTLDAGQGLDSIEWNYHTLKALAKVKRVRVESLIALATQNDPFYTGQDAQIKWGKWFAEIWDQFGYTSGVHLRRIHYQLVSQEEAIVLPDGGPSWATIRRAQGDLGITPYREGFGKGATWMWALTEDPPEVQRCSPDPIDAQSKDVSTFDDREHLCTDGGCGDWADENIDLAADAGEEFDFGGPA